MPPTSTWLFVASTPLTLFAISVWYTWANLRRLYQSLLLIQKTRGRNFTIASKVFATTNKRLNCHVDDSYEGHAQILKRVKDIFHSHITSSITNPRTFATMPGSSTDFSIWYLKSLLVATLLQSTRALEYGLSSAGHR